MEKDHFKDRTIETTLFKSIKEGDYVYICEKAMQDVAETIEDLTLGRVTSILTKHDHTRGIKVSVEVINPEFFGEKEEPGLRDNKYSSYRKAVGRVVYCTEHGRIITK